MKTVLILGGSYGGIGTAHRLLKQTAKTGDLKVVLLSTTTHLFWNLAAVRAIVPGQFADDALFQPIAPGFKQYQDRFELVIGTAERMDTTTKKVVVSGADRERVLTYDILVLATGSRTKEDVPFKGRGSYEATRNALHDFQSRVTKASSIVIGGAGATGVEVAGELGFEYGQVKKVTLISSGARILEGTPPSVSKTATKQLTSLNVALKLSTKISGSATMTDERTELTLSDGQKLVVDLYLPTVGVLPNSAYIPQSLLNHNGFVVVDEYLKVKSVNNVWAVGDVSSIQRPQYVNTEKQSVHAVKNILLALNGKPVLPYKADDKDTLAVPVGRKVGTGHMGNMRLPGFLVHIVKGKTYFTQNMNPVISGSGF